MFEIFILPFFYRALIIIILLGFTASYYGVFIVQRKMSFLGSGLAHSAFGGVALGILLSVQPLIIAIPFTLLFAIFISYFQEKSNLSSDTIIGIFFSIAVSLGIIFLSLKENYTTDAFTYLFGSLLSVQLIDVWTSIILTILTTFTFFKYWSRWTYATFDYELAIADKLPVRKDNYILNSLIAITVVVSIKIIGIILISAYIVIPGAIARLLSKTFRQMTILAIIIGVVSGIIGLLISILVDLPSGAVIVLFQSILMISVFIFKREK
ncbi:MAG: manganese transporter [Ignavibacteria bacterium GWF2_33_9]|nr:MAG: manganese transporter [Ignavibacteria bacterium GWF2_33_9]